MFFGPICKKKRSLWTTPKIKQNFLAEVPNENRSSTFRNFLFYQNMIYGLTDLWIFFYLEWCFLSKKCHFQLKQLWGSATGMRFLSWVFLTDLEKLPMCIRDILKIINVTNCCRYMIILQQVRSQTHFYSFLSRYLCETTCRN